MALVQHGRITCSMSQRASSCERFAAKFVEPFPNIEIRTLLNSMCFQGSMESSFSPQVNQSWSTGLFSPAPEVSAPHGCSDTSRKRAARGWDARSKRSLVSIHLLNTLDECAPKSRIRENSLGLMRALNTGISIALPELSSILARLYPSRILQKRLPRARG
ncbi:hypothetical protein BC834DRAFT_893678 [Gloeopeniophorella convolvens]|nr:hypothetical protein BC834DRAFT_893678 [Gloeopeniophorella convolvens]